jgi:hypothetical protein
MAKPFEELLVVLDELTMLLKNPDVTATLSERRVNASLAMVAVDGLRAYVEGNRTRAMEEFSCVAEEIAARASFGSTPS